jgi:DNA processing protein
MTQCTKDENTYTPDERIYILALSRTAGIGPRRFISIIKKFKTARRVFSSRFEEVAKLTGVKLASEILSKKAFYEIDPFLKFLKENSISYLTFLDDEYPSLLKEIYDPPIVIYYTGDFRKEDFYKSISVVGTRQSSDYGALATRKIIGELVDAGFTIVSGMAFGIDSCAHKEAIASGGRTIAVLPQDAYVSSPRSNEYLYNKIKENGCVISEYMLQKETILGLFPSRNRIVSGISWGTLVIEAPCGSGALITARCALDQGREVFALPGSIFSSNTKGTNDLIKNGEAKLIQDANDILEEYGIVYSEKKARSYSNLTQEERNIIEILQKGPASMDEIVLKSRADVSKISQVVTMMEIRAEIVKGGDGRYMLVL